ncbi:MAG: hypothetical protein H8E46_10310 [FCB group bacterium]|nr:hypothetical protein [FCB group bacterium]
MTGGKSAALYKQSLSRGWEPALAVWKARIFALQMKQVFEEVIEGKYVFSQNLFDAVKLDQKLKLGI